jgi:hypothetical protein
MYNVKLKNVMNFHSEKCILNQISCQRSKEGAFKKDYILNITKIGV